MLQQGVALLRRSWQECRRGAAVLDEGSGLRLLLRLLRHLKLLTVRICILEIRQENWSHRWGLRIAQYCQLIFRRKEGTKEQTAIRSRKGKPEREKER